MSHDAGGLVRIPWPSGSVVEAIYGGFDERFRYCLQEIWDPTLPLILWIMMNPSVADEKFADPTLIKTGKFSRRWGFGGQIIGNVYAYRATDQRKLLTCPDPIGPDNDKWLAQMAGNAASIILAYGSPAPSLRPRGTAVARSLARTRKVQVLRLSKDGRPWHPLYIPLDEEPKVWRP